MALSSRVIVLLFITISSPFALSFDQQEENVRSIMKLLSVPQKPERHIPKEYIKQYAPNIPMATAFSWNSCGKSTDPITANVTIAPDPITIPGNITVAVNASLQMPVQSPVKLELTIQKKIVFWITIPCIDNVGSCTYDDACVLLSQAFPGSTCPPPFSTYKLPCHCPFQAGKYSLPPSEIDVNITTIPEWLTTGDYKVKAVASSGGKELACYDVALTLN